MLFGKLQRIPTPISFAVTRIICQNARNNGLGHKSNGQAHKNERNEAEVKEHQEAASHVSIHHYSRGCPFGVYIQSTDSVLQPTKLVIRIVYLRASNNITLKQNRLRSSKVLNIIKHCLCSFSGSRGIEILHALPLQNSLDLVRRIGGELEDLPALKTIGGP